MIIITTDTNAIGIYNPAGPECSKANIRSGQLLTIGRQEGRQESRKEGRQEGKQAERQAGSQTVKQTRRQAGMQGGR